MYAKARLDSQLWTDLIDVYDMHVIAVLVLVELEVQLYCQQLL